MTATASPQNNLSPVQRVEAAKGRLTALQTKLARAQALLEAEQVRLANARSEAAVEYGVDTLEGLRELHAQRNAENDRAAAAFLAELEKAESALAAVEAQLQAS